MARATNTKKDSTAAVVDILNQSGRWSTETPGKRRRNPQLVHGRVGRPSKRSKISQEADAGTSEEFAMLSSTIAENQQETDQTSKLSNTTGLQNPKSAASTRQRRPAKTPAGADMYAVPNSPNAPLPTTNRCSTRKSNEYSLEHSVFDSLPSNKQGKETLVKPPSQNTRSKSKKSDTVENHTSPLWSARAVRAPRKIPPKPATGNSIKEAPFKPADEKTYQSSQASPKLRRRTRGSRQLAYETSINEPVSLGYPSLEKLSRTRGRLINATSRLAAAPAIGRPSVTSKTQHSLQKDGDHQTDAEEEGEEEEEEDYGRPEDEVDEGGEGDRTTSQDRTAEKGQEVAEHDRTSDSQSRDPHASGTEESEGSAITAVTDGQRCDPSSRQGSFQEAAKLYECGEHWAKAWDAAKENQDKSDPETRTIRKLVGDMQEFRLNLLETADLDPDVEEKGSLRELYEEEVDKIAIAMGNLKKSRSRTGANEERMRRDIYHHAIPRAVELLRTILVVRSRHRKPTMAALEELITVLTAARKLCERLHHWKPTLHLGNLVKSRTNSNIKLSLSRIEDAYRDALSDLKALDNNAQARVQEKIFAEKQKRSEEARQLEKLDNRQKMVEWYWKHDSAGRHRQETMRSRQQARDSEASSQPDAEVYDVDDVDSPGSTPLTSNDFAREGTEDIPVPTKRVWQEEETLALLPLLQKYRGLDRYERIQESISEIARDIRRQGPDNFRRMIDSESVTIDCGMVGDVLDDLGNIEVADIQQQAKYLKASQARKMNHDIQATGDGEKWAWLLSV